jgi:hypothetical protein
VRAEVQRALFEGNLRVANAVLQESNPIRYASGRYHAVAPRPRRAPNLDVDTDTEDSFLPTVPTTVPTSAIVPDLPALTSDASSPSSVSLSDVPRALLFDVPLSVNAACVPQGRDVLPLSSSLSANTATVPRGCAAPPLPLTLPLSLAPLSVNTSSLPRGCISLSLPLSASSNANTPGVPRL